MRKMLSRKQTIDLVNEAIESGEIHADPSTEVKVGDINSESATAGKVIVADGEGGAEWGSILPAIASGDSGKVLKVNAGETGVEWGSVSGGTQLYKHVIVATFEPLGNSSQKFDCDIVFISAKSDSITTSDWCSLNPESVNPLTSIALQGYGWGYPQNTFTDYGKRWGFLQYTSTKSGGPGYQYHAMGLFAFIISVGTTTTGNVGGLYCKEVKSDTVTPL